MDADRLNNLFIYSRIFEYIPDIQLNKMHFCFGVFFTLEIDHC